MCHSCHFRIFDSKAHCSRIEVVSRYYAVDSHFDMPEAGYVGAISVEPVGAGGEQALSAQQAVGALHKFQIDGERNLEHRHCVDGGGGHTDAVVVAVAFVIFEAEVGCVVSGESLRPGASGIAYCLALEIFPVVGGAGENTAYAFVGNFQRVAAGLPCRRRLRRDGAQKSLFRPWRGRLLPFHFRGANPWRAFHACEARACRKHYCGKHCSDCFSGIGLHFVSALGWDRFPGCCR